MPFVDLINPPTLLLFVTCAAVCFVLRKHDSRRDQPTLSSFTAQEQTAKPRQPEFDVFISHAGEQKNNIVAYLQDKFAAENPDVKVFVDEDSLQPGNRAMQKIQSAMEDAAVAVLVLSPEFVRKAYPMEELNFLLKEQAAGRITIVTLLYHITYDQACNLMKTYSEQPWLEGKPRPSSAVLASWASDVKTLLEITLIRSEQVPNAKDTLLAERVVSQTLNRLHDRGRLPSASASPAVELPRYLVAIAQHRATVMQLLQRDPVVLVHGMGGIGKTTVAKAVYNHLQQGAFSKAPCHIAMLDINLTDRMVVEEQEKMIRSLVRREYRPAFPEDGRMKLRQLLEGRRVLVVVDNVFGSALQMLLPPDLLTVLDKRSRVLVTSRDREAVQRWLGVAVPVHDVQLLLEPEAVRLFCLHAFDTTGCPDATRKQEVRQLVGWCGGLPLALMVAARQYRVCLEMEKEGEGDLDDLKAVLRAAFTQQAADPGARLDATLFQVFDYSYSKLKGVQQALLLDLAMFLRGQRWDDVQAYLSALDTSSMWYLSHLEHLGLIRRAPLPIMHGFMLRHVNHTPWGLRTFGLVEMHDTLVEFCQERSACDLQCLRQIENMDKLAGSELSVESNVHGLRVTGSKPLQHLALHSPSSCRILQLQAAIIRTATTPPSSPSLLWLHLQEFNPSLHISTLLEEHPEHSRLFTSARFYYNVRPPPRRDSYTWADAMAEVVEWDGRAEFSQDVESWMGVFLGVMEFAEWGREVLLQRLKALGQHLARLAPGQLVEVQGVAAESYELVVDVARVLREHLNPEVSQLGLDVGGLLAGASKLTVLSLEGVHVEVLDLARLPCLASLKLRSCQQLKQITGPKGSRRLKALHISTCRSVTFAWSLTTSFPRLATLILKSCKSLTTIPGLEASGHFPALKVLILRFCPSLTIPTLLPLAPTLESFDFAADSYPDPQIPDGLHQLSGLRRLSMMKVGGELDLSELTNLISLDLNCFGLALAGLTALSKMTDLVRLSLRPAKPLPPLSTLRGLQEIQISNAGVPQAPTATVECSGRAAPACRLSLRCCPFTAEQMQHSICTMGSIDTLTLHQYDVSQLPDLTAGPLARTLTIQACTSLQSLSGAHLPATCETLNVEGCRSLTRLHSLGATPSLVSLNMVGSNVCPDANLLADLMAFHSVQMVLGAEGQLHSLEATGGDTGSNTSSSHPDSTGRDSPGTQQLCITGVRCAAHLPTWPAAPVVDTAHPSSATPQSSTPAASGSSPAGLPFRLQSLTLSDCILDQLPAIATLPTLTRLALIDTPPLNSLLPLTSLTSLHDLTLQSISHSASCLAPTLLHPLSCLTALTRLHIQRPPPTTSLPPLHLLSALRSLFLDTIPPLPPSSAVPLLPCSLATLTLCNLDHPSYITATTHAPSLVRLHISNCSTPNHLHLPLPSISSLSLSSCPRIQTLPDLHRLQKLQSLDLQHLPAFQEVCGRRWPASLQQLRIVECGSLDRVPRFIKLGRLERLQLRGCGALRGLPARDRVRLKARVEVEGCALLGDERLA